MNYSVAEQILAMMSAFSFDFSLPILVAVKLVKFVKRQKQLVHRTDCMY